MLRRWNFFQKPKVKFQLRCKGLWSLEVQNLHLHIKILDLKLRFKKIILKPETINRHLSVFQRGGIAALPFQSNCVSTHTIPIGTSTINIPEIASGPLPSQVLIGNFIYFKVFFSNPNVFNSNVKYFLFFQGFYQMMLLMGTSSWTRIYLKMST